MSTRARRIFDAQDVTIACAVALLAQLGFVAVFSLPSPELVQADISDDNAQPIAVSITPILKLGSKTPTKTPSPWQRQKPIAAKTQPTSAAPSPQAEKTPEAIPTTHVSDAGLAPTVVDAGKAEPGVSVPEAGEVATASSTRGSEQGAANGTETDPLRARALDQYRARVAGWFAARFDIRGKVPFETLKTLQGAAHVSVSDRKLVSFNVTRSTGNSAFDAEVQSTLSRIQSSGAELPAPPTNYPDMLASSFNVTFQCNVQKNCE